MAGNEFIPDGADGDWRERQAFIVDTMRDMSRQTDPQAMVRAYGTRMRQLMQTDRTVSLSRRDLPSPKYRITRSSLWREEINPWHHKERLPVLEGGLLGDLIYGDEPRIIDEIQISPSDPAAEYFAGMGSLIAVPNYDQGLALNMVVLMRKEPAAFQREQFPMWVWMSNLFGRATHNLVLSEEVKKAYEAVDYELKVVADIQRSLLPKELPDIPNLKLAAHYQTSRRAGGDYYDFFPLPSGQWGILIADVSGHGTPAAVLMAITHSIAHSYPGPPTPPAKMLDYVNRHLASRYSIQSDTFVTAFYGIFDPATRTITYACAGHNPPRCKRCAGGGISALVGLDGIPLGIEANHHYRERTEQLQPGDQVIFYTDGITEATNAASEMFGVERLDRVLGGCREEASDLLAAVLGALEVFTAGKAPMDDQTLLVAKVS
jgi:sigma-B regulation protein RsbU (phosphoserine phosphatase)